MAIFDRIRRAQATADEHATPTPPAPVAAHLLPTINQRVTVSSGPQVPVPSRVEDLGNGRIVIAHPTIPVQPQVPITISWEREDAWYSLETTVLDVHEHVAVPIVAVAAGGRLSRYDERRADVRRLVELPLRLRVLRGRGVRAGRDLQTVTTDVSSSAISFATTAPLAPGDLLEVRLQMGSGALDVVTARVRVIRTDAMPGTWRGQCTAAFEEILRSDRARIMAVVDAAGEAPVTEAATASVLATSSSPPTSDGVGGRDQPDVASPLEAAVSWLRRRA